MVVIEYAILSNIFIPTAQQATPHAKVNPRYIVEINKVTWRVLGKIESPDNAYGTNVNLIVQAYEHELTAADHSTPGV